MDWFGVYEKAKLEKCPKIDLVNDTEVLACWLFDIPDKQRDASNSVIEITSLIGKCKDEIQVIEDKVSLEINNEVDEKGKSKFSNQSIRDAEMRVRLVNNEDYAKKKRELVLRFEDLGKAKSEVEYWSIMFSAVKNEVYHRRTVEILDSKKELYKESAKNILNDEN